MAWLWVWLGINVAFVLLMWRRGVMRERAEQAVDNPVDKWVLPDRV